MIIKDLLNLNVPEAKDIERCRGLNIACLSNFALCCWKREEWVALNEVCDEILGYEIGNFKAFYRKMLANYKQQKYEFVEDTTNDF